MKHIYLFVMLLLISNTTAIGQFRLSVDVGSGYATAPAPAYHNVRYDFSANSGLTYGLTYLKKINHNLYLGGKIYHAEYAFTYKAQDTTWSSIVSHSSSYLFIAPIVDYTIDKWQILHVFVSASYGFLTDAAQTTTVGYAGGGPSPAAYASDGEINRRLWKFDIGFTEHIRWDDYWHITITETYGFMQDRLTSLDYLSYNSESADVKPGYWSITIGLMHKYGSLHYPERDE
jgi:hypothetical protein